MEEAVFCYDLSDCLQIRGGTWNLSSPRLVVMSRLGSRPPVSGLRNPSNSRRVRPCVTEHRFMEPTITKVHERKPLYRRMIDGGRLAAQRVRTLRQSSARCLSSS